MTKGKNLPPYVHRRKRDRVLLFVKPVGKGKIEIRLETQFPEGSKIPFELHQEVEKLLNQPRPVAPGRTFAAMVRHYIASDKYRNLAPRTAGDYDQHIGYLLERLGKIEPKRVERRHVIEWLNDWTDKATPHRANYRLRVLRLLLEHSLDMGLLPTNGNPAKGVSELRYERKEREPWPSTLIAEYRATATDRALLLFELCLGTGQRIGDVLKMKWGDIQDDGINVRQNKTGKKQWVPLTSHLRAALHTTQRRSVYILTNQTATGPWSYRGASQAIRNVREAIGALDYDIHSLRYSAASELLIAGADDDVIAAITGQSAAMVAHYTRSTRQKVRAMKAKDMRE